MPKCIQFCIWWRKHSLHRPKGSTR